MKTITKNCVAIQAPVQTKEEAIRLAGKMLLDAGYIAANQGDVGRFDRDIGAAANGKANVSGGQGRRIVDPVAHHRQRPLGVQRRHFIDLISRQQVGTVVHP